MMRHAVPGYTDNMVCAVIRCPVCGAKNIFSAAGFIPVCWCCKEKITAIGRSEVIEEVRKA